MTPAGSILFCLAPPQAHKNGAVISVVAMNVKKPDVGAGAGASRTFNIEAVSIAVTPSWRHVERLNVTTEVTAAFQYVFLTVASGLFRPHVF